MNKIYLLFKSEEYVDGNSDDQVILASTCYNSILTKLIEFQTRQEFLESLHPVIGEKLFDFSKTMLSPPITYNTSLPLEDLLQDPEYKEHAKKYFAWSNMFCAEIVRIKQEFANQHSLSENEIFEVQNRTIYKYSINEVEAV